MSAVNAFVRQSGAWLIADTAGYDHAGNVIMLEGKVAAREEILLAMGLSGRTSTDAHAVTEEWLARQFTQTGAVAGLPSLLRSLVAHDAEAEGNGALASIGPIPRGIRLTAVWWDRSAGRGWAGIMSSNADLPGAAPFTLKPLRTLFSPPLSADPWPRHVFDPQADAAALARLQRLERDELGVYRVGGAFERVRVHAGGVDRDIVAQWPDRIGKPLRVAA